MDLIKIERVNDCDVVDSRLIAIELGIQHKNFFQTIKDNQTDIEQDFGILLFSTEEIHGRGQPEKYVYLNEDQATYLMTLSRNTPQVKLLKRKLVKSFSVAKQIIGNQQQKLPTKYSTIEYVKATQKVLDFQGQIPEAMRQVLMDGLADELLTKQQQLLPENKVRLVGVAQRAEELGYPVKINNRSQLGKFVKKQGLTSSREKRLCNGELREINVYEDSPELDNAISLFYS